MLGAVVSVFSIVYALSSPLIGHLLDRIGLRRGAAIIVALLVRGRYGDGARRCLARCFYVAAY